MADIPTTMNLADYLASLRQRTWRPGVLDCGIFMADWLVACGLRDPIADLRGTYSNERQFLKIIRREGDAADFDACFIACCAARLAAVGMRETSTPAAGDILNVSAPYAARKGRIQRRATGAICVSEVLCAVVTSDLGVVIAGADRLPVLRAWTYG